MTDEYSERKSMTLSRNTAAALNLLLCIRERMKTIYLIISCKLIIFVVVIVNSFPVQS